MKLFDAHTHWPAKKYAGIQNLDYWKTPNLYPHGPFCVGPHPWYLDEFFNPKTVIDFLEEHSTKNLCKGIGECGLDFFKLNHSQEEQTEIFATVLDWCKQTAQSKPLIIHSVKSETQVLKMLKDSQYQGPVVWHNYLLKDYPKTNCPLYASLSFRFFQLPIERKQKILASIPHDRILIESDELEDAPLNEFAEELANEKLAQNFTSCFGEL